MAIDPKIWDIPASKGDVAGVAIQSALAVRTIYVLLLSIRSGRPFSQSDMDTLSECADNLDKHFVELSGWARD